MQRLTLDPCAIIVCTSFGLRVYSTQGTIELRAKSLAGVHERVHKHLRGQYTEKTLISAVPLEQRATLRRYLYALRNAGAIPVGNKSVVPDPRRRVRKDTEFYLTTKLSDESDSDQRRGSEQASVKYVTHKQLSSLLVQKDQPGTAGTRQVYVLADDSSTVESDLGRDDRQAFYSRWLLSGTSSSSKKLKIDIFQINKSTGALTRKATFTGKRLATNREVPKALELVHATDIEQVPLAICEANSILRPVGLRWFGVDYNRVADEVLRDIMMRLTVESTDAIRQIRWRRMAIAKDTPIELTVPRVVRADECLVARSFGELRLRLLEYFIGQTQKTPVHAEGCDLLQPWSCPDLDYLAQVLRQRHSHLEAHVKTRADGLYECVLGDLCTASVLRHKALRDLMILLTWRTYYGHRDDAVYRPAHECDYSLIAKPLQLRRLFISTAGQSASEVAEKCLIFAKISCWGREAWLGTLDG